jgi:hypothetical protein
MDLIRVAVDLREIRGSWMNRVNGSAWTGWVIDNAADEVLKCNLVSDTYAVECGDGCRDVRQRDRSGDEQRVVDSQHGAAAPSGVLNGVIADGGVTVCVARVRFDVTAAPCPTPSLV